MSFDHNAFLVELSRFAGRLLTSYDIAETLDELAENLTRYLELAGAAVNLSRDSRLRCTTAVPAALAELEDAQTAAGQGPCVQAYRTGTPVMVSDVGTSSAQWPEFSQVAGRLGLKAVAGIPMRFADQSIGVVSLYDDNPRNWTVDDISALRVMADMATGYLVNASKIQQQQQLTEQLQFALDSRVVIEQAKGVIATTHRIGVEEAFKLIQRHARSHHSSVRAVADAIVNLGLRV